uniref:RING-type E3 ubiquitin transferase n=1 Tax=Rhizophora mucronata TaxID=61149 RepID=A0A2P2LHR6_RHIMU
MDAYSGKRPSDGFAVSKKGSALVVSDSANNRDRNAQFCSRIGCSGRLNAAKGVQISSPQKGRSSRSAFHPSSVGKEIIGSSSKPCSAFNKPRKSLQETQRILSSPLETDSSETSSVQDESGVPDLLIPPGRIGGGFHPESDDTRCHPIAPMEVGSSSVASSTRSQRTLRQRSGLGNQDNLCSSPVALASKSKIQGTRTNASRYGLKNLQGNSKSDVVHSGSSSSDSNLSRKKDVVKKRICDGESSSSAKEKKMNWSSVGMRNPSSSSGISISDTRRAINGTPNGDGSAPSVRTRRTFSGYTRARAANQRNGNNLLVNRPHVMVSQMSQPDISLDANAPSSSHPFSMETSLSRPTSYGRSASGNESLQGRPSSPAEVGNSRSLPNRESFRHYNTDGIAEVLLALERIEQDEELTYEQLLVLETNLFLNGLSFNDQHRDMRLDIDNMSYEELLALEERMGTVSTALTEEALSECLEISTYCSVPLEYATASNGKDKDDVKCSICQDEYADGDEVGSLECKHMYHVVCIRQWLGLKNWCPVCKGSAAQS